MAPSGIDAQCLIKLRHRLPLEYVHVIFSYGQTQELPAGDIFVSSNFY